MRTIGKGGMGAVYVARDPAIDRLVAIKLLRDGIDSPEVRERFKREARSAGKLRHPNIVTIFHVGDHESRPYIVMEYIPGETLAGIIRQQTPLTIARKLRIVEELCRGLAYAHKAGIVHRDVKPLNILVDTEGAVKILDFGIARVGDQGLTQLGMMMGTPNYMSPEQISPGRANHRSDVFAVGLVLYELLTYRRAFPGDDFSVSRKSSRTIRSLSRSSAPASTSEIVQVLNKALAKRPTIAIRNLAQMRQDLARIWARLKTPDDEGSGEIAPLTPPETVRYDGPTLVPGPNEQGPQTTQGPRAASDLARDLARLAAEKRKAEELASTPPLGTPQPADATRAQGANAPPPVTPPVDDAAERERREEEARRAEIRAIQEANRARARQAPPAAPPQADPTRSGPKTKPPVTYTSTSEPTVFMRRGSPGADANAPADQPAAPSRAAAPPVPPPAPAPASVPPSVPRSAAAQAPTPSTQNATSGTQSGLADTLKSLPPWAIPVGAIALIGVLLGLSLLFRGGSSSSAAPTATPTQEQAPPARNTQVTQPPAAAAPAQDPFADLRARIAGAISSGDIAGAIGLLQGQPASTDPAFVAIATTVVDAAKASTAAAFEQAQAAGANERPSDDYRTGLTTRADADAAAAAGRYADAAKGYLDASQLFGTAATAAAARPSPPQPQPVAPRPVPTRAADTQSNPRSCCSNTPRPTPSSTCLPFARCGPARLPASASPDSARTR
ncbi:MAG: serine/threonine-protein kinase [Vicinamibacterales bacterium]